MRDASAKGRGVWPVLAGASNGNAKLTREEIGEIRLLLDIGISRAEIARRYGVTAPNISSIALGKTRQSG
jgi:DNA invertase Pin-like site-specific DNA recombinase